MRLLKQAMAVLGTVTTIALLVAVLAPKSARAVVAAFVQIVPGTATHVGQNESQLVALACLNGQRFCVREDPSGGLSSSPFVVPAGYTLIITEYSWTTFSGCSPNTLCADTLLNEGPFVAYDSTIVFARADATGTATNDLHFTPGVRIASGVTVGDNFGTAGTGEANVWGYLVPN